MIPSSHTLVTLKLARQALLSVEESLSRGTPLPAMPHVRTDRKRPHEHSCGAAYSRPELRSEASSEQSQAGGRGAR